jgi:hypothetical protein
MDRFEIYSQLVASSSHPEHLAGTDTARIDEVLRPVKASATVRRQQRGKAGKAI